MTATATETQSAVPARDPQTVVRDFLTRLQASDLEGALALLADDVEYTNVSLPTIRGRARVERALGLFHRLGGRFRVYFHVIASDGSTVLTDRTDAMRFGPVEQRFWVYGRFEVAGGRITVWRDSFDWGDILVSLVRGTAGALIPAFNRRWPGDR